MSPSYFLTTPVGSLASHQPEPDPSIPLPLSEPGKTHSEAALGRMFTEAASFLSSIALRKRERMAVTKEEP